MPTFITISLTVDDKVLMPIGLSLYHPLPYRLIYFSELLCKYNSLYFKVDGNFEMYFLYNLTGHLWTLIAGKIITCLGAKATHLRPPLFVFMDTSSVNLIQSTPSCWINSNWLSQPGLCKLLCSLPAHKAQFNPRRNRIVFDNWSGESSPNTPDSHICLIQCFSWIYSVTQSKFSMFFQDIIQAKFHIYKVSIINKLPVKSQRMNIHLESKNNVPQSLGRKEFTWFLLNFGDKMTSAYDISTLLKVDT